MGKHSRERSTSSRPHKRRRHRHELENDIGSMKKAIEDIQEMVSSMRSSSDHGSRRKSSSKSRSRSRSAASSRQSRASSSVALSVLSAVSGTLTHAGETGKQLQDQPPPPNSIEENALDESTLLLLGSGPKTNANFGPNIHGEIAKRWIAIARDGLNPEELLSMKQTFQVPDNCQLIAPPKLNPEIEAATSDYCLERDKQWFEFQDQISTGISALGRALSDGINLPSRLQSEYKEILTAVSSASRILLDAQYKISVHRKKMVTPKQGVLPKIAAQTKHDRFLFGDELKEKVRVAEELTKAGKAMIATKPVNKPTQAKHLTYKKNQEKSKPLNSKGPIPSHRRSHRYNQGKYNTGPSRYHRR